MEPTVPLGSPPLSIALGLHVPNPDPSIVKLLEPRSGAHVVGAAFTADLDTVIVDVAPETPPTMIMAPRKPDCRTFSMSPDAVAMMPWINPETPRSTTELAHVTATFVSFEMVERFAIDEVLMAWATCAAQAP
jgi:hypothetical protein